MEFTKFVEWAFYAMVLANAAYVTSIIAKVKDAVDELNVKFAVLVEKQVNHDSENERIEKHISKLEDRIERLELKRSF